MTKYFFYITFSFLALTFSAKGQVKKALPEFTSDTILRHAQVSFSFKDVSTGKTMYAYNPKMSCVPASVTKLITTATALEMEGAAFKYKTTLETDGTIDSAGCLQGNLYIYGTGDPTLGSKHFSNNEFINTWIAKIKEAGIKSIEGSVLSDISLYDQDPVSPLWLREDLGSYYGAGVFPLSVFDNTVTFTFQSGAHGTVPSIINTDPAIEYEYENNLITKANQKDSIYIIGDPYSMKRYMFGAMRDNQAEKKVRGDISNPPLFLAQYLTAKLLEQGIEITGQPGVTAVKDKREIIYTHNSPTLGQIAKITNVLSNNNYAEHMLKHLSLTADTIATFSTSLHLVRSFWKRKGFDVSGLFMYDGSGLTPKNAVYSEFVTDLLIYMRSKSKYNDTFYASLPIAGQTGTVSTFLRNTELKGRVRVKSGSFRNVHCYAGYFTKNNKEYAFCLLVNNFAGERKKVIQAIEKLLLNIDSELGQ